MDRRSRFSPEPLPRDLGAFRTRAASQPPRTTPSNSEQLSFTLPENLSTLHRPSQWPPQRLGRSPVVSRAPPYRSASFSAGNGPEGESWQAGHKIPSAFDEDDEESLDTWDSNLGAEPRSWGNSDSRLRSNIPGPRSRSLVANFTNPLPIPGDRDFLSTSHLSSSNWNDRNTTLHHSIDYRFLQGHSRADPFQSHSLQSTASMPVALNGRSSNIEISNMSPFARDRGEDPSYHEPWPTLASMREEDGMASGATSRRHSVSVVQPRARGVGFGGSGYNAFEDDLPSGVGRSIFSDEELAGDLGMLSLHQESNSTLLPYSVSRVSAQSPPRSRLSAFRMANEQRNFDAKPRSPSVGRSPIPDGRVPPASELVLPYHPSEQRPAFPDIRLTRQPSPGRTADSRGPSPSNLTPAASNWQDNQQAASSEQTQGLLLDDISPTAKFALVQFKLNRKELFYHDANLEVKNGDRLVVEGDRGKDVGLVVQANLDRNWLSAHRRGGEAGIPANPHQRAKRALGVAGPQEIIELAKKEEDEQKALQLCQTKVRQKKLPMQVVDCEFQWDRRKLTFFFVSESRIDFRDLVRELFRLYKTRIWMSCVSGPLASNATNGSLYQ